LPPRRADIVAVAYAAGGERVGRPLLRARLGILDCGRRRVAAGVGQLVVEALASLVGRRRAAAGVGGRGWRAGAEPRRRRWLCVVWGIERLSRLISEGLVRGWALSAPSNTDRFWSVGYFDCTV
jgi:hypothetical protein